MAAVVLSIPANMASRSGSVEPRPNIHIHGLVHTGRESNFVRKFGCKSFLMLLAICVNTPIEHSVFQYFCSWALKTQDPLLPPPSPHFII